MMKFNFNKTRQFNSKSYNTEMVKEFDEFYFLKRVLNSFREEGVITKMIVLTSENGMANIHVETRDKTLIKWLLKFGFEEA